MENTNPQISVIVPVYNAEKYLRRCVDSILTQTFTDFELLLIDDGSKDKSGKICDEYANRDHRVKVFHKENGGVSSARNVGLDNAIGEWIAFVDSDDWVENDFLRNFINEYSGEELLSQGFISPNWEGMGKKIVTQQTRKYNKDEISLFIIDLYGSSQLGYIWCKLFKREIIKKHSIRFTPEFTIREDMAFVCKYCTYVSSISNISDCAYNYVYPSAVNKYVYQDSMGACKYIYQNVRRILHDNEISIFKSMYIDAVICSLMESRSITDDDCRFFLDEFLPYLKWCNSPKLKVRLFKNLCVVHKMWYVRLLILFIRSIYRIKYKMTFA